MDLDKKIFEDKTVEDILKEAYNKRANRESTINFEIQRLSEMITSPGEAIAIIPLIKPLIDANLKNDEVLIKILDLFKKSGQDSNAKSEDVLSEKDLAQLLMELPDISKDKGKKLIK